MMGQAAPGRSPVRRRGPRRYHRGMPDPTVLSPAEIVALVRASTDAAVAEVRALGARSGTAPAPGEWSAKEVLGHLIEADRRGFVGRMRAVLAEDRPTFVPWDQPAVAAARGDAARDPEELIGEFLNEREEGLRFAAGLDAAACARQGLHPRVGPLSIGDILHEWVHHDREHVAQMLAVSQALVWPAMGNARRFSDPEA
jgi:hypothetical protein